MYCIEQTNVKIYIENSRVYCVLCLCSSSLEKASHPVALLVGLDVYVTKNISFHTNICRY